MENHILVVDDSDTIQKSVATCLHNAGYGVSEAFNGLDPLEKMESMLENKQSLSLIPTDINMPFMDGITFIGEVRKGIFRFIPILVLSSEPGEIIRERGISAGASGWLKKTLSTGTTRSGD